MPRKSKTRKTIEKIIGTILAMIGIAVITAIVVTILSKILS